MESKFNDSAEREEQASVTHIVAEVLAEHNKKSKFLRNVGFHNAQRESSIEKLEAQLAAEQRANADLQLLVNTQREQIDALSGKIQESEEARQRDKAEVDQKLQLLLSRISV
jgi:hypothetical protein